MRFIMLAQPRTGTTVFGNLINWNKITFMYREAFAPALFHWGWYSHLVPKIQEDPTAVLPTNWGRYLTPYFQGLFEAKEQRRKLAVGIDIKYPQTQFLYALPQAIRECGAGVLHMRRRNSLAAIVSYRVLAERLRRQGGRAHGPVIWGSEPVKINIDWLKLRVPEYEQQDLMMKITYQRDVPYLELFYEDFISEAGWLNTAERLTEFFGCPVTVPFVPRLKKQSASNLADMITNADEVIRLFPQYFTPEMEIGA